MKKRTWFAAASLLGLMGASVVAQQTPPAPAAGLWHLIEADADEKDIRQHRLDIRLYPTPAPFRAARVNRNTNEESPYSLVEFDGKTLRLVFDPEGLGPAARTWLKLTWDGVKFTGNFVDGQGKPVANPIPLKLIRAPK